MAWISKFCRQHPIKITDNLAKNIERLEEKLKEAQDYINTWYEVEDRCSGDGQTR